MSHIDQLKTLALRATTSRWRNPVVVGISVLLHGVILAGLALSTFALKSPEEPGPPPIYIEMQPRPLLQGETPRTARSPALTEAEARAPAGQIPTRPDPLREDEEEDALTRPDIEGVPGRQPADPRFQYQPESDRARVGRSLRTSTLGCNARNGRMPAGEQAICDEAFGEGAARANPITGTDNPRRDARFSAEGQREMDRYEARRRPLAGGTGVTGVGDCPGSNFGMGCPGAHLDPGFRQDTNDTLDEGLRDRDRRED